MKKALLRAVFAGVLASSAAWAGVNVNNGNFYIAYTDFFLPTAGINIDVTRTYNSRSSYVKGIFGVGWSSEFEGYLKFNKDNVEYYEGGGGNIVSFNPAGAGVWSNALYGQQSLKKSKETYVLTNAAGKILNFQADGRLSRIADKNGNYIDILYKGALIETLRDNFNNQVRFFWQDFGNHPRVVRVERDNLKASYTYSKIGNLEKVVGIDGIPYAYSYDDQHNMTKITYNNGTYKEMAYNKARDWVTRFRDQDGMTTTYDYFSDSLDPENKFGTTVVRAMEGSRDRETSKFWYEFRKRADGSRFNYRAVTSIRNVVTETIFTECCGTPLVISQWPEDTKAPATEATKLAWTVARANKSSTYFEYTPEGLLKKKTAPGGQVTSLAYDPVHKKVSEVQKGDRKISYSYDSKGNLAKAFDHREKRNLSLQYDVQGRILSVQEQVANSATPKVVFFRYDANGRPIEIKERSAAGKEGIIRMSYDSRGEVTSVLNGQGRALASAQEMESARQVALTFQNLLEIVQPAGVTLSPEG